MSASNMIVLQGLRHPNIHRNVTGREKQRELSDYALVMCFIQKTPGVLRVL